MKIKQDKTCKYAYLSAWYVETTSVSLWWTMVSRKGALPNSQLLRMHFTCISKAKNTRGETKWFELPYSLIIYTVSPNSHKSQFSGVEELGTGAQSCTLSASSLLPCNITMKDPRLRHQNLQSPQISANKPITAKHSSRRAIIVFAELWPLHNSMGLRWDDHVAHYLASHISLTNLRDTQH